MNEVFENQLREKLHLVYLTLLKMGARKEDAEDIIQETTIQFLQYLDGISPTNAGAWLYRVAINKYYDLLKKEKTVNNYILSFDMNELLEFETPEDVYLKKEYTQNIQQLLKRLSTKDAELLLLKYSAEFSLKEIAILFHTTDKTVKTQLARARIRLMTLIKEEDKCGEEIDF